MRPPHDAIDLIRRARLGALRVPVEQGGGGATMRELFETVVALAAADSNVDAHRRPGRASSSSRNASSPVGDDRWMGDVLTAGDLRQRDERLGELGDQDVEQGATFATTLDGLILDRDVVLLHRAEPTTRTSCPSSPPRPRAIS